MNFPLSSRTWPDLAYVPIGAMRILSDALALRRLRESDLAETV